MSKYIAILSYLPVAIVLPRYPSNKADNQRQPARRKVKREKEKEGKKKTILVHLPSQLNTLSFASKLSFLLFGKFSLAPISE